MYVNTTDALVLPVTAAEFAEVAKLDDSDPAIIPALYTATNATIAFLKLDLIAREWKLIHETWPTLNNPTRPSVSRDYWRPKIDIELPYANLISVGEVLVSSDVYTDYRIIENRPTKLRFDSITYFDFDEPDLQIAYTAGYGTTAADVPEVIKQAIIAMAMYTYNHAGSCDSSQALEMSGAKSMLTPYAVMGGLSF